MKIYLGILWLLILGCRERYYIPLPESQSNILVVEGFINTEGISTIRLSRATPVGEAGIQEEKNAIVTIEEENGANYPLAAADSGKYVSQPLLLDNSKAYRVSIRTSGDQQYVSAFSRPVITPIIDSLTWKRYLGGVEIYVDSRDPVNNTKYYRWEFDETWEFRSHYVSEMKLFYNESPSGPTDVHVGYRDSAGFKFDEKLHVCWQSRKSSAILIGTTERLSEARVYNPLVFYPQHSWEMSVLYSINVRQYGLSKPAYQFYTRMKKNTESLGSIFDAQPSEITGNIINVANPKEIVVGHVEACSVTEKRLFVAAEQLDDWHHDDGCKPELFALNQTKILLDSFYLNPFIPTTAKFAASGAIVGVYGAEAECVDCTLRGTNSKPSFWP